MTGSDIHDVWFDCVFPLNVNAALDYPEPLQEARPDQKRCARIGRRFKPDRLWKPMAFGHRQWLFLFFCTTSGTVPGEVLRWLGSL